MSQADIATHTGVSASSISRLEGGAASDMTLRAIRTIAAAYGFRVDVIARWRGGDLDRLLSAHHSAMHESVSRWLARFPGWIFVPEATFSFGRETGIVDVLGWHPATRTAIVLELKPGHRRERAHRRDGPPAPTGVAHGTRTRLASTPIDMPIGRSPLTAPGGARTSRGSSPGYSSRMVRRTAGASPRTDVLHRTFPAGHRDLRSLLRDPARIGRGVVAPACGPGQPAFGGREGVAGLSFFAYAHGAGASAARDPNHRVSRRSRVARAPGGERGAVSQRSARNARG
jgi:transcriptional regulator with XRE-family HTH domain